VPHHEVGVLAVGGERDRRSCTRPRPLHVTRRGRSMVTSAVLEYFILFGNGY
jgi:hypothetical protein